MVALVVNLRLLLACRVAGLGGPRKERCEAATSGAGERPGPFDELLKVGDRLRTPVAGGRQGLDGVRAPQELDEQLVRIAPRARLVQPAEHGERLTDGPVPCTGLLCGEDVEPATAGPMQEQLVVAEPEECRVQRAVHGRTVARVVDGAEAEQGVVDLAPLEVRLAAIHPVRHAGATQRFFERLESGRRAVQDRDVLPARCAWRLWCAGLLALVDGPPRGVGAVHGDEERSDRARLVAPGRLSRTAGASVGRPQEHGDARPLAAETEGLNPLVAWLSPLLLHEHGPDHVVDPGDHRRSRAEVLLDGQHPASPGRLAIDQVLDLVVHGDVGATEAVDRLLGIAHHEELARSQDHVAPVRGQRLLLAEVEHDLCLQRVGVLELVDQEVAEPALQEAPRLEVLVQEVPQAPEEVAEVEEAELALLLVGPAR